VRLSVKLKLKLNYNGWNGKYKTSITLQSSGNFHPLITSNRFACRQTWQGVLAATPFCREFESTGLRSQHFAVDVTSFLATFTGSAGNIFVRISGNASHLTNTLFVTRLSFVKLREPTGSD